MEEVTNWNRYPKIQAEVSQPREAEGLSSYIHQSGKFIVRGNGRCYGDSALQSHILSSLSLNRFLKFDTQNGLLTCESGVLLSEVLEVIVPKGFFLPVTPGTKFITLGGAIAANVHGKNHHKEGAISNFVESLVLLDEEGKQIACSRENNSALFFKTLGGMGLTGVILEATLKLKPIETAYIAQKSIATKNLDDTLRQIEANANFTYSVAWVDTLRNGRGILFLGEHCPLSQLPQKQQAKPLIPHKNSKLMWPKRSANFFMNRTFIRVFNGLYYFKNKWFSPGLLHYDPYFYPLDGIENWNYLYGKNGFLQYQFVLPHESAHTGMHQIFDKIKRSGCPSFLAVLKAFGNGEEQSPLSFPMPGLTLALDFKADKKTFALLKELDQIVLQHKGKLYLAKDARASKSVIEKMYPNFHHSKKFQSLQSERLGL